METYQDLEKRGVNDEGHLYNWVFHYNHYNQKWAAIPREAYLTYWSDKKDPRIFYSNRIETLMQLIRMTDGEPDKLDELAK